MKPLRYVMRPVPWASTSRFAVLATVAAMLMAGCGGSGASHRSTTSHTTSNAATSTSAAASATGGFTNQAFASGIGITHPVPGGKAPVTQPDDLTKLGEQIFVAFQNGVGPQGEPTSAGNQGAGNRNSTIVEFSSSGSPVAHWDVAGHVDGLTADTARGQVAVTANEDANAHLYMIAPATPQPTAYRVPALPHNGGLDAVSFYHGMMLISASAPGTRGKAAPQASYPAVYVVRLNTRSHTATVHGLFGDEATSKNANADKAGTTRLALTDPDSNAVVPAAAARFGGQFELTSQADEQQIFAAGPGARQLSVLKLSQSIDDTAWASDSSGTLYVTDNGADLIYKITGPFQPGMEIVSVSPCDAGNAPASCPAPGFPDPYLGRVDASTGAVTKLTLPGSFKPKGLMFVP